MAYSKGIKRRLGKQNPGIAIRMSSVCNQK